MISLLESSIHDVHERSRTIDRWAVWFRTPVGLHSELSAAINWCTKNDMNPDLMIVPVPVAVAANGMYEAVSR